MVGCIKGLFQGVSFQSSYLCQNHLGFCHLKRTGRNQWNDFCENHSSVKWGHLGHFDLKLNFPTNPMGSSGPLWARLYNNNYNNQNKN